MNNIHSNFGFSKGLRPVDPTRAHLQFGDFLTMLPTAPIIDAAPALSYPMDGNDTVGDCVVAGWDHYRQVVSQLLTGTGQNFTQAEIWAFYKTQNPNFDPAGTSQTNGPGSSSDGGMNIQTFLEYLVAQKYILGFAKIDQKNPQQMMAAIYIGLAIITGVTLDQAQMQQFSSGTWDVVAGSPVDGGHCIPLVGYQSANLATCVTWGALINCTENFILKQMNEAWFVLTQYHVDHPSFRNHFDLAGFSQAVNQITGGKVIVPVPTVKPSYYFSKTLSLGQTDADVLALQKCLNYDPITALQAVPGAAGSPGHETNYFGALTFNAIETFQKKYNISAVGSVGPITRGQLNTLFSMHVNQAGLTLIEGFEGFVSSPYVDITGKYTIGYGFTYDLEGHPITAKTPSITQDQAQTWLQTIIVSYVDGVLGALTKVINQNQLNALTSFTYNLGIYAFQQSSICSKINTGQPLLETDFTQYSFANGIQNPGLLIRRQKEFVLFHQ